MATTETVKLVGKWAVGYDHDRDGTVIKCEWSNREPIVLMFRAEDAVRMAKAVLAQHENPPPRPGRMS